jgi:DNA replication protein DnaC
MSARSSSEDWQCPHCGGDGFVLDETGQAVACTCRAARVRRARSAGVSSVIPRRYRGVSFDRAPITELSPDAVGPVRAFVRNLDDSLATGEGLWIMGDVGTGKTTLAMVVSTEALRRGYSVAIYSLPRLLAEIRDTYDSAAGERSYAELFRQLAEADLLHLDDLGAEKQTEWVLEQLYCLINERYEEQRSVIVTTNLTPPELEEQIGQRAVSRLVEMCREVHLYGDDRRSPPWERSAVG